MLELTPRKCLQGIDRGVHAPALGELRHETGVQRLAAGDRRHRRPHQLGGFQQRRHGAIGDRLVAGHELLDCMLQALCLAAGCHEWMLHRRGCSAR